MTKPRLIAAMCCGDLRRAAIIMRKRHLLQTEGYETVTVVAALPDDLWVYVISRVVDAEVLLEQFLTLSQCSPKHLYGCTCSSSLKYTQVLRNTQNTSA